MRRSSGAGRITIGRRLRKNGKIGAHDHLRGRERTERAAGSMPPLGSARTDPVGQYYFRRKVLSAMAGLSWWNFYFRLFPAALRNPQIEVNRT